MYSPYSVEKVPNKCTKTQEPQELKDFACLAAQFFFFTPTTRQVISSSTYHKHNHHNHEQAKAACPTFFLYHDSTSQPLKNLNPIFLSIQIDILNYRLDFSYQSSLSDYLIILYYSTSLTQLATGNRPLDSTVKNPDLQPTTRLKVNDTTVAYTCSTTTATRFRNPSTAIVHRSICRPTTFLQALHLLLQVRTRIGIPEDLGEMGGET